MESHTLTSEEKAPKTSESINDADWELVLARSDDVVFVDDTTQFECVGCRVVFVQHYVLRCGHNFCFNCKNNLIGGKTRWKCPLPTCARRIREIYLQKLHFDASVYELSAHCPNYKYGCPFVATLRDLGGHLKMCGDKWEKSFSAVYLEKKLEDVMKVVEGLTKKLDKFDEKFEAMNSGLNEMQKSINEMKSKEKDDKLVQRRKWAEFDKRINSLAAEFQNKLNVESGCTRDNITKISKLNGKSESWVEMMDEESTADVSDKIPDEITTQKQEVAKTEVKHNIKSKSKVGLHNFVSVPKIFNNNNELKTEVDNLGRVNDFYKESPDFTWIVSGVTSFLNRTTVQISSAVFPLRGYPFGAQVKLNYDIEGSIYFGLAFKLTERTNWHSKIQPVPTLSWTIKDRSSNPERKDFVSGGWFAFADRTRFNKFTEFDLDPPNNYSSILSSPLYRVNDTVVVDVHVEPPDVNRMTYSHNGTLEWTVDGFRKRKQIEEEGHFEGYINPYFYTSPKGYKIQTQMFLNGKNSYKNQGLTIEIDFVNGLYDDDLPKSFPHTTTIVVFHPNEPHKKITEIVEKDLKDVLEDHLYAVDIGTHQEIENLLNNDTLTYTITIETQNFDI